MPARRCLLAMAAVALLVASAGAQQPIPTADRDPNFIAQGDDGVLTWTVSAEGIPLLHSFRYGSPTYIGFDKAGTSYLRVMGRSRPVWSYRNGRAQELWEAPAGLMRPAPVSGGPTMADLAVQYGKVRTRKNSAYWIAQFTPRPAGDTEFDPNFYGAGESQQYFWGGLDEGRPQIYSPAIGQVTYLGFDRATGVSYLQTPLDKKIYSYKQVPWVSVQTALVAAAPAGLSQPPSKPMRLDAAAAEQLAAWQKAAGPNKDPNFWDQGVDPYFEWREGGEEGPRIQQLTGGGNAFYIGFDETTGMSYLALSVSTRQYWTYKGGNGRPIPVEKLPAHLMNVPRRAANQLTGTAVTPLAPGGKPENGSHIANAIAHTGNSWTVTFIDELGARQTLPMTRPNIVGYTPAMWEDANKNHLGVGMWLASTPDGKVRVVVVEVSLTMPLAIVSVTVAPPATLDETIAYAATKGIVIQK